MPSIYHGPVTTVRWSPRHSPQPAAGRADDSGMFDLAPVLAVARLIGLAAAAPPAPVEAGFLPGAIDALAATAAGVMGTAGPTVRVWDVGGTPVRTLWPAQAAPPAPHGHANAAVAVPGVTADSGWTAPYDPDDAEPQDDPGLANETTPRISTRARAGMTDKDPGSRGWWAGPRGRVVIAAAGASGWIGRADGLWRIDLASGEAARVFCGADGGVRAVGVSSDGRTLAVTDGGRLWRSRDGGLTFEVTGAFVTGSPRGLAATRGGNVVVVDATGARIIRAGGFAPESVGILGASDVVACGSGAVILSPSGLHGLWDASGPTALEPITTPPGTDRMTCGAGGARWWVRAAAGIFTSTDRGQTWLPGVDPGAAVAIPALAMAATDGGIWLATAAGLTFVAAGDGGGPHGGRRWSHERPPTPVTAPVEAWSSPDVAPRWWWFGLPRIDLSFTSAQTTLRREIRGFVMATFTLGRPGPAAARAAALARELARRRRADEQARAAWLMRAVDTAADPTFEEQRQAFLRILQVP
ncbi:MAG: hypothetical protein ABUL67_03740 [Haliangium ochraceum]